MNTFKTNKKIILVLIIFAFIVLGYITFKENKQMDSLNTSQIDQTVTIQPSRLKYNPTGTSWDYNGGELTFEGGNYIMDFGCNIIRGDYSVMKTTLKFNIPASTKKACPPEIQEKEAAFSKLIVKMDTYSENENQAKLSGGGEEMILTK